MHARIDLHMYINYTPPRHTHPRAHDPTRPITTTRTDALEVRAVPRAVDHGAVAQEVDGADVVGVGGCAPVYVRFVDVSLGWHGAWVGVLCRTDGCVELHRRRMDTPPYAFGAACMRSCAPFIIHYHWFTIRAKATNLNVVTHQSWKSSASTSACVNSSSTCHCWWGA